MKLHELKPPAGSKKKPLRVGRGTGSGHGKTSGRGIKGQNSRSGGGVPPYFEGGQLPLVRRLPHMPGFVNHWRIEYKPVNLDRLSQFQAGSVVSPETLVTAGIIKASDKRVSILARGDLDRALTIKAHHVSASARQKIEAAGGSIEIIEVQTQRQPR